MAQLRLMDLCRLCLVKDRVTVPIFEGEGVAKKLCMKIGACLPVKVSESDRLPKKVCDDCIYKVELVYSFWNTTANAEKQLLALLGDADSEPQVPPSSDVCKTEGEVKAETDKDVSCSRKESAISQGSTSQISVVNQIATNQSEPSQISNSAADRQENESSGQNRQRDEEEEEDEEESDEDGYSEEEDEEAPVEDLPQFSTLEPTFVNVDLMGEEAGPSGLQQDMDTENMEGEDSGELSTPAEESQRSNADKDGNKRSECCDEALSSTELGNDGETYTGPNPYLCTICDLHFANKSALDRHEGVHRTPRPLSCHQCSSTFAFPYQLKKHSLTHSGQKPHACPFCNVAFSTQDGLNNHLVRRHSTDRPYICDICQKSFKFRADLNIHRKIHSNDRKHICDICGHAFIQKSSLVAHRTRHTKQYKYSCSVCLKGFYSMQEWQSHELTHSGIRPFKCTVCGRAYSRKTSLVTHEKSHLPGYQPRTPKHQCETCGKLCHSRLALSMHWRTHTGVSLFNCALCNKSLGSRYSLEVHLRTHTGERPHVCEVCGKTFNSKKNLGIHTRVHTGEKRYACTDCGKKFTQCSTLTQHKRHGCAIRSCQVCKAVFQTRADLAAHQQAPNHKISGKGHGGGEVSEEVSEPGQVSVSTSQNDVPDKDTALVQVIQMYLAPSEAPAQVVQVVQKTLMWESEDVKPDVFDLSIFVQKGLDVVRAAAAVGVAKSVNHDEGDRRRSRRIVEKSVLFPQVLLRDSVHSSSTATAKAMAKVTAKAMAKVTAKATANATARATSRATASTTASATATSTAAVDPLEVNPADSPARLPCKACGKMFLNARSLKQHAVVHSETRPFKCELCGKSYKRHNELTIHQKKHHTNPDRLQCDMCDYTTIYRGALDQHMKRHNQEYKYRCETCGKGFYVRKWLIEHQNVHTGEKPFKCDECDKSFSCNRYMIAHKKTSHPPESVVPKIYQCDTCGSVFAHRNSLRLHNKMHTGENVFVCDICGKVLTSKDHLKLHRRIHTGEKPYACSYCEKAFSKKHTLTQHERVHTGERPYTCDQCGKSFSQRSTLVIHLRYHTGQRPYVCPRCNKAFVCTALLNAHLKNDLC